MAGPGRRYEGLPDWRDEGVAVERTALAYTRSMLAIGVLAAAAVHDGVVSGSWGLAVPMIVVLLVAAGATRATGGWEYAGRAAGHRAEPHAAMLRLLASCTTLAGLGAGLLVVVG